MIDVLQPCFIYLNVFQYSREINKQIPQKTHYKNKQKETLPSWHKIFCAESSQRQKERWRNGLEIIRYIKKDDGCREKAFKSSLQPLMTWMHLKSFNHIGNNTNSSSLSKARPTWALYHNTYGSARTIWRR